jgi:hypothetical protein
VRRRTSAVNGATGRIVLAVSPDTPAEAVDAAVDRAAERGLPLLAVRLWHDPHLSLGGWLRPERLARWDAADRKARRVLDNALAQARAAHPEVEVTTVVADDDPVPFLAALSTRADRDGLPGPQLQLQLQLVRNPARLLPQAAAGGRTVRVHSGAGGLRDVRLRLAATGEQQDGPRVGLGSPDDLEMPAGHAVVAAHAAVGHRAIDARRDRSRPLQFSAVNTVCSPARDGRAMCTSRR